MRHLSIICLFLLLSCGKEKEAQILEDDPKTTSVTFRIDSEIHDDINYLQIILVKNAQIIETSSQKKSDTEFGTFSIKLPTDSTLSVYYIATDEAIPIVSDIRNIVNINNLDSVPVKTYLGKEAFTVQKSPMNIYVNLVSLKQRVQVMLNNDLPVNADMIIVEYSTNQALGEKSSTVSINQQFKITDEIRQQHFIKLNCPVNLGVYTYPEIGIFTYFTDVKISCLDINGELIATKTAKRYSVSKGESCAVVVGQLFNEYDIEVVCIINYNPSQVD